MLKSKKKHSATLFMAVMVGFVGMGVLTFFSISKVVTFFQDNPQVLGASDQLISFWQFDEETGSAVFDSQGVSDGTLNNTFRATGASCYSGGCLQFNGVNSSVSIPHSDMYNIASDEAMTIGMRVKFSDISSTRRLLYKGKINGSTNATGWFLSAIRYSNVNGMIPNFTVSNGMKRTSVEVNRSYPLVANKWYYLVVVFDRLQNKLAIYVDGVQRGIATVNFSASVDSTSSIVFGAPAEGGTKYYYKGFLDDLFMYRGKLSEGQDPPKPGVTETPTQTPTATFTISPSSGAPTTKPTLSISTVPTVSVQPSVTPFFSPTQSPSTTPFSTSIVPTSTPLNGGGGSPTPLVCIGSSCVSSDGIIAVGKSISCSVSPSSSTVAVNYEGRCELLRNSVPIESFRLTPVNSGAPVFQPFILSRGNATLSCVFRVCSLDNQTCSPWGQ